MIRLALGFCIGVVAAAVFPQLPEWAVEQIARGAAAVQQQIEQPRQITWEEIGIPLIDEEHVKGALTRD